MSLVIRTSRKATYGGRIIAKLHKARCKIKYLWHAIAVKPESIKPSWAEFAPGISDYLIGIQLNDDAEVMLAVRVPDVCRQIAGYASHDNKFVIHLNSVLLKRLKRRKRH